MWYTAMQNNGFGGGWGASLGAMAISANMYPPRGFPVLRGRLCGAECDPAPQSFYLPRLFSLEIAPNCPLHNAAAHIILPP